MSSKSREEGFKKLQKLQKLRYEYQINFKAGQILLHLKKMEN